MECPAPSPLSNSAFVEALHGRILRNRVPFSGSIDLTYRCNLRCVHCYCTDRSNGGGAPIARELTTDEFARLFDALAEAGCLYLLLTGGEPLLRTDFETVYRRAKTAGFFLTVFTNGTMLTPHLADLFHELPPRQVEITLYGASEETYRRVTGVAGAYSRTRAGIEALLSAGVKTRLKTVVMRANVGDFEALKTMADNYGLPFRFDSGLTGRMDGNLAPLAERIPAADAIDLEFANPDYIRSWEESLKIPRVGGDRKRLFNCGAGQTTFHIDFNGILRSCITSRWASYDLRQMTFAKAWDRLGLDIAGVQVPDTHTCNACTLRLLCAWCPVFADLEGIPGAGPSPYLCAQAVERSSRLERKRRMETEHERIF